MNQSNDEPTIYKAVTYHSEPLGSITTEDLLKNLQVSIDQLGDNPPYQFAVTAEFWLNDKGGARALKTIVLRPM